MSKAWRVIQDTERGHTRFGKPLAYVGGALVVANVVINKGIKPSDILNGTMSGLAIFGGPIGDVIAGTYYSLDLVTMGASYISSYIETNGQNAQAKGIGDYLDEAVQESTDSKDSRFINWDK